MVSFEVTPEKKLLQLHIEAS
jgi:hypothetical protein